MYLIPPLKIITNMFNPRNFDWCVTMTYHNVKNIEKCQYMLNGQIKSFFLVYFIKRYTTEKTRVWQTVKYNKIHSIVLFILLIYSSLSNINSNKIFWKYLKSIPIFQTLQRPRETKNYLRKYSSYR